MAVVVALVVAVVAVVVVNRGAGDEETQSSAHRFRGGAGGLAAMAGYPYMHALLHVIRMSHQSRRSACRQ